jgi:hypothetical protein
MRKLISFIVGTVAALVLLASPASASTSHPSPRPRSTTCTSGYNGIVSGHLIMWVYRAWQPCTPVKCHRHRHGHGYVVRCHEHKLG